MSAVSFCGGIVGDTAVAPSRASTVRVTGLFESATTAVAGKTARNSRTRFTPYLSASTITTDASRADTSSNASSGVASII
jgi:hypothetical protein